jgi:replication factor C large subunit
MAGDFVPWVKKYAPKTDKDLEGLEKPFSELREYVTKFKRGKGILLYGGSGAGKTSSVYALAHSVGFELIEINASDTRNAESINSIVGSASKQASLFFPGKIILVDEVEGLTGREDRGGVQALVSIIEESRFPIIATCQDPYDQKLKNLRKACKLIEYKARPYTEVMAFLKRICEAEGVESDEEAISLISRKANGDLRAAINDLQSTAAPGKRITRADVEHLSDREKKEKIETSLLRVFKTTDAKTALGAFDNSEEDLDEIFLWVDANLPVEYLKPEDLARGFDALSMADVFKGRIMRWQHYRFYVYCYDLLTAGIALAKDEKYKSAPEYKETGRKLKIWIANMKNMKKKAISEKVSEHTHTSKKNAFRDTLPYIKIIAKHDKKQAQKIAEFLDLDNEQAEYLAG